MLPTFSTSSPHALYLHLKHLQTQNGDEFAVVVAVRDMSAPLMTVHARCYGEDV